MTDTQFSRPWLPFGSGPADADARLFCLPFAGGGASNFAAWRNRFPGIGVAPVQYPGHETRIDEVPLQSIDRMVTALADAITPLLDRPYLLFGYSMGAKLAFALTKLLASRGFPQPACLMVAAHVPPDRTSGAVRAIGLPDSEFKQVLRAYGGMPEELLDDEDFCAMALPVMRADFAMAVQGVDLAPVDCPVVAYAGIHDAAAGRSEMAGWQRFTRAGFRLREFDGGHFFLRTAGDFEEALKTDVDAALQPASHQHLVSA